MKYSELYISDNKVQLYISEDGDLFTDESLDTLVNLIDNDAISVLEIHCDLAKLNDKNDVCSLIRTLKALCGNDKQIDLYVKNSLSCMIAINDVYINEILCYIDNIYPS